MVSMMTKAWTLLLLMITLVVAVAVASRDEAESKGSKRAQSAGGGGDGTEDLYNCAFSDASAEQIQSWWNGEISSEDVNVNLDCVGSVGGSMGETVGAVGGAYAGMEVGGVKYHISMGVTY